MSNAAHILDPRLRAAAKAFLGLLHDSRAALSTPAFLGLPLNEVPEDLFAFVVQGARGVLAAADAAVAAQPPQPRAAGPLNRLDADALRLELDAGTVLILARDKAGSPSGALSGLGAGGAPIAGVVAQELWSAVARTLAQLAKPSDPPAQEPSP